MKVDIVIGTRPEAIKMAPVYMRLKKSPLFRVRLISTGQHRELLDQSLKAFGIVPDIGLEVFEDMQTLEQLTSKILLRLGKCFEEDRPDIVLGHGDTTTAFAAALTAFYKNIPFGHIEAGYRTFNVDSPFPEEFNRQTIAKIAAIHFPADHQAFENLVNEGVSRQNIVVTGQTVCESIDLMGLPKDRSRKSQNQVLVTLHRRDNLGESLDVIFDVLSKVARKFKDTKFVAPLHPSPRIQILAKRYFRSESNIKVLAPLSYADFLRNITRSRCVLTDSGGVQEEANYLGKPALILRESTERHVGIDSGLIKVVGYDQEQITEGIRFHLAKNKSESSNVFAVQQTLPSKIIMESLYQGGAAC